MIILEERVDALASVLSELGIEAVLRIEESDPQFRAVRRLVSALDPCLAVILVVGNALVSYRLSIPGEEYWEEFSLAAQHYYARAGSWNASAMGFFRDFLPSSRGNRLGVSVKLRRLEKLFSRLTPSDACMFCSDLKGFQARLSRVLGTSSDAKTVVFAVKMLYYACRAMGRASDMPMDVDIPVDTRIAMLAATSGIVSNESWRRVWRTLYERRRGLAARAWRLVAEGSGIPPLHLDAVLWLPGRAAREAEYRRDEAVRLAYRYLAGYLGEDNPLLLRLAEELFYRLG